MESRELYRKAFEKAAQSRQRALTLAKEKKLSLYDKIPMLLEIDNRLIKSGIAAAQLAANSLSTAEMVQQQQEETCRLEKEKQNLLILNGYSADYLKPIFSCKICGDTGKANGKTCSCIEHTVNEMRFNDMTNGTPLKLCSFESFSLNKYSDRRDEALGDSPRNIMQTVYSSCQSYVKNFKKRYASLMLVGESGLGKTHLALAIANNLIHQGYNVVYLSAQSAFRQLEEEKFKDGTGLKIETLLNADLLILDDLGTEFLTPFVLSCLYTIINERLNSQRPTIYTTNILEDDKLRMRYTDKIASRLLGSCTVLSFFGDDIRLK